MFRKNYKNDNDQIIASPELIRKTKRQMKEAMTMGKPRKRHFVFKGAVAIAATAAVMCLCMFGNFLPNFSNGFILPTEAERSGNSFSLTAYAAEQQPDGIITKKELEFSQAGDASNNSKPEPILWSVDGEKDKYSLAMFRGIAFEYEGTNIENILFTVDNGYFSNLDNEGAMQRLGASYKIDPKNSAADNTLFWGVDVKGAIITHEDGSDEMSISFSDKNTDITIPGNVVIEAAVTFTDGEVLSKNIVYDTKKGTLMLIEK